MSVTSSTRRLLMAICCCILVATAVPARAAQERYDLFGDLRLRLESDWDSRREDGSARDDRSRGRVRGRVGINVRPKKGWTLGARLRTGAKDSQQSPHITVVDFDSNPTGDHDVLLDKWFVRAEQASSWVWLGRNSFPFWKQSELFWDDDVTPAGVALGQRFDGSGISLVGGYFALPDGSVEFNGRLLAGQASYSKTVAAFEHTLAGGLFLFEGDDGSENLRLGNGARDYAIWVASYQSRMTPRARPVTVGIDLLHNSESYSANDPDPFTAARRDDRDGLVLSAVWGKVGAAGDWLAAYTYARIEALAVNASYAGDDWVRWGSATQTDASDLKGHELRFSLGLGKKSNLNLRLFVVEAIRSVQDGNRLRLDYNYSF